MLCATGKSVMQSSHLMRDHVQRISTVFSPFNFCVQVYFPFSNICPLRKLVLRLCVRHCNWPQSASICHNNCGQWTIGMGGSIERHVFWIVYIAILLYNASYYVNKIVCYACATSLTCFSALWSETACNAETTCSPQACWPVHWPFCVLTWNLALKLRFSSLLCNKPFITFILGYLPIRGSNNSQTCYRILNL